METMVIAYVPVLHAGYRQFIDRHRDVTRILLVSPEFARTLDPSCDYIRKDLRALDTDAVTAALRAWYPSIVTSVVDRDVLGGLARRPETTFVLPDDDVSRQIVGQYLTGAAVTYDEVFLRWHRENAVVNQTVNADRTIPFDGVAAEMLGLAERESVRATNWWRRVGAVIARDGKVLLSGHNSHVPSPHLPYAEGDVRSLFHRGEHIDLNTDLHAEARLIAEAARRGLRIGGADLYVTTFPCPPCAKSVAHAGIARCFFSSGYAMLDGERVLREASVELIFVQKENPPTGE
ncbi:MAG: deoxycytidylate deaminase [Candidatus Kerfeldbacteria bacterium]|nr:deoxycytidylate deaminase [Candidatus Kerfeldbacteria bacterium]